MVHTKNDLPYGYGRAIRTDKSGLMDG